jgi:DNA invertase Pin-like site-specific DNA recombinase
VETKPKRAFGYLRVSSESQVDGDGFPRQRAAITKWAAANNVKIVRWFEEKGVSGTLQHRPALDDMLVALMSNGVQTVIVEKLDRIARDILVQETIIQNLHKQGFELVSAMEPDLCIDDPSRKLMRQIMGAFAEYDRTMIVLKTRAARERIRKSGKTCEGRKPFGFRKGEQETLNLINELRTNGVSNEKIAATLNEKGITTRSGGKWFGSTIYNMFKDKP